MALTTDELAAILQATPNLDVLIEDGAENQQNVSRVEVEHLLGNVRVVLKAFS